MPHDTNYNRIIYIPAKGFERPYVLSTYLPSIGEYTKIRFIIASNGQLMFVLRDIIQIVSPWSIEGEGKIKLGSKLRAQICKMCGTQQIPKVCIYNDAATPTYMNAVNFNTMAELVRSLGNERLEVHELRRALQDGTVINNMQRVMPMGYGLSLDGMTMRRIDCPLHRSVLLQRLALPSTCDSKRGAQAGDWVEGLDHEAWQGTVDLYAGKRAKDVDYMWDSSYIQSLELMANSEDKTRQIRNAQTDDRDMGIWRKARRAGFIRPAAPKAPEVVEPQQGAIVVTLSDSRAVSLRFGFKKGRLHFAVRDLTLAIYPFIPEDEASTALLPWVRRVCLGALPLVEPYGQKGGQVEPMVPHAQLDLFLGQSRADYAIKLRKLVRAGSLAARVYLQVPEDLHVELEVKKPAISVRKTVGEIEGLKTLLKSKASDLAQVPTQAPESPEAPKPAVPAIRPAKRGRRSKEAPPTASEVWARACAKFSANAQI